MIYSRWGSELEITGNCGSHRPEGVSCPGTLVRAIRSDDRAERFYFAHTLRADGGLPEIREALDRSPLVTLDKLSLAAAIHQAS